MAACSRLKGLSTDKMLLLSAQLFARIWDV